MAVRRQPGALDLPPQQRDRARAAAVGERSEQPDKQPHPNDVAGPVEAADADRIHVSGAVHRGAALGLGEDQQFAPADELPHVGRQRREVAQPAEDRIAGVGENSERWARRPHGVAECVVAEAEIGEVIVVEPAQKIDALGDLSRRQRRRCGFRLAGNRLQRPAHLLPVRHRAAYVVEDSGEPRRQRLALGSVWLAGDLDLHPGFAKATLRRVERQERAGVVARHREHRMDRQADLAAALVDRRGHRIDEERHVVVDDLDDRVRRGPAVGRARGVVDPQQRAARPAAGGKAPQRQRRVAQRLGAARRDVARRHVRVHLGDEAGQQRALGALRALLGQGLGIAQTLLRCGLDRARHGGPPSRSETRPSAPPRQAVSGRPCGRRSGCRWRKTLENPRGSADYRRLSPADWGLFLVKRFLSVFRRGVVYWLPLAVLLAATTAHLVSPELFNRLSLFAFDKYQQLAPRQASPDFPVQIVDIDEHSLKQLGQWPWPRTTLARMLDKLAEAGAAVVAFDVLFTEPDRTSPEMLRSLLTEQGAGAAEAAQVLASMPDPDAALAKAMTKVPVVVGFNLTASSGRGNPLAKAGFAVLGAKAEDPWRYVDSFPEAVAALPELQKSAAGNGFVNEPSDWDNIVRHVPLVFRLANKPVPSLAAEAMRVGFGGRGYLVRYAGAQAEQSFGENSGLNAVEIPVPAAHTAIRVPVNRAGQVTVYYARRDPRRYISAADIVAGKFAPERIADHIVLVGSSAAGLNDLKATPIAPDMPGVEVHAQLIEQILERDFLFRPDWGPGAEIIFALLSGLLLIATVPRLGALLSAELALIAAIGAVVVSWLAFRNGSFLIDPNVLQGGHGHVLPGQQFGQLPADRAAPARNPPGILALPCAATCRGAGEKPRETGPRRRDPPDDHHVLRHSRLHDIVGRDELPRFGPADQRVPDADDGNHHGAQRNDR